MAKEKNGPIALQDLLGLPEGRRRWGELLLGLGPGEENRFRRLALTLCKVQARHVTPLERLLRAQGGDPRDWREIPPLPQELFKRASLFAHEPRTPQRVFETSGTTARERGRHSLLEVDLYRVVSTEGARRAGVPWEAVELHFLVASPEEAPRSSLSAMFGFWAEANPRPSHFWIRQGLLDETGLRAALARAVRENRPVGLCGTAFAFVPLLDCERGAPLPLPRGSFLLETGGFKGRTREISKRDFYHALETTFGIPTSQIWSEYGMTELSSQAYAQGVEGTHRTPPWTRVRVLDPLTGLESPIGARGLAAWIDLANIDSVLGIQTQDEAIATGDGFRLLGRSRAAPLRGCSLTVEDLRSQ
ncbi:acyl-protein synthetase [Methylacidimicrobium sp. B4]|uniref:LuxE/PaaK family acyltransferase n=1 Tax=Methylacidimicrobium sp. B4 TaxID=2796139 RepID=UPI001A8CF4F4|nr:acyl-protein synthetase [Methylacidimicrobium sp. B4]QSR83948.1 acyl-protein synthetase [Methylacidimicrobium sp. B4]